METQFYVVSPLNTNYRVGDTGGDITIHPAPTADYYTALDLAVVAARKLNEGTEGIDALQETGAFVMSVAWLPDSPLSRIGGV